MPGRRGVRGLRPIGDLRDWLWEVSRAEGLGFEESAVTVRSPNRAEEAS